MSIERRPLIDTQTVASQLGLSPLTVAEMARRRRIPSVLIGRTRRFRQEDIDAIRANGTPARRSRASV